MRPQLHETKRLRPNVLPTRASAVSPRHRGSVFVLQRGDARRSQFRSEHSSLSEFQINNAVGRNDAVFIFHVLARAKIDTSTGVFNQEPSGCNVPQADPLFDVGVESSTGDISKVESSAAEDPAFPDAMNHLLEQWKVRVDRLLGFCEPNRNN